MGLKRHQNENQDMIYIDKQKLKKYLLKQNDLFIKTTIYK